MAEYTDLTCPVCHAKFLEGDDIVVCPVCGTPHHRACYQSTGHCAHLDWHREHKTFDAAAERGSEFQSPEPDAPGFGGQREERQTSTRVCPRCGFENDPQALFCNRCGAPVSQGFGVPQGFPIGTIPFGGMDPEEELDSVAVWKLSAVVRENGFRFLRQFRAIARQGRRITFNFCAFLFAPFYFLYRKMYGLGTGVLLLSLFCYLPALLLELTPESLSQISGMTVTFGLQLTVAQQNFLNNAAYLGTMLLLVIRILTGLFADFLYFLHCKKLCCTLDRQSQTREDFLVAAARRGGVNRAVIIILIALYVLVAWSITFFIISPDILGV